LSLAQHAALVRLWLLDLDHHVGAREHLGRGRDDLGTRLAIHLVTQADAGTGHALDDDLVAIVDQFIHAAGGQANTVLMGFYFFRYTDEHDEILCDGWVDGENLASPRGSIDVVIKEIFAILPNRNILSILQQDGRISFSEPARRVGLSTTH